jgi:hypothetical protein
MLDLGFRVQPFATRYHSRVMDVIEGALCKSDRPAADVRQIGATDAPTTRLLARQVLVSASSCTLRRSDGFCRKMCTIKLSHSRGSLYFRRQDNCCGTHNALFSVLLSPRDQKRSCGQQVEPYRRLLLLPKHLRVGLAVRVKAIMFTAFPSGFQFGSSDVPVLTAFLQHGTQVLP